MSPRFAMAAMGPWETWHIIPSYPTLFFLKLPSRDPNKEPRDLRWPFWLVLTQYKVPSPYSLFLQGQSWFHVWVAETI